MQERKDVAARSERRLERGDEQQHIRDLAAPRDLQKDTNERERCRGEAWKQVPLGAATRLAISVEEVVGRWLQVIRRRRAEGGQFLRRSIADLAMHPRVGQAVER